MTRLPTVALYCVGARVAQLIMILGEEAPRLVLVLVLLVPSHVPGRFEAGALFVYSH